MNLSRVAIIRVIISSQGSIYGFSNGGHKTVIVMCVCRVLSGLSWCVCSIKLGRKSINQQPVAIFIDILLSRM